jgi:glycosyltransferase involved in cell wall biosynthesis
MSTEDRRVDLFLLGQNSPAAAAWPLGDVFVVPDTAAALATAVESWLQENPAPYVFFWDSRLGRPDAEVVRRVMEQPGDVWHAGLKLGTGGWPRLMDAVAPTWMLTRDPDPEIEATSWRLSLRACLARTDVVRHAGGPWAAFSTLEGAGLELGHRYLSKGAITRHIPALAAGRSGLALSPPPAEDELRFMRSRMGRFWSTWALGRGVLSRGLSLSDAIRAWRQGQGQRPASRAPIHRQARMPADLRSAKVTVLIPTLHRYPYLRTVLRQLRDQTIRPVEVIIVDQTPEASRDRSLAEEYADLSLRVFYQERPGQCSARNLGLLSARGDFILFIDDDVEVPPGFIEAHLQTLHQVGAGSSSGVVQEVDGPPAARAEDCLRVSDVFPTCNTLIRRDILEGSGLFDLAYDGGEQEDGDLGMRVYLSGVLMVLNPEICILHHHAPSGGLRSRKARVVTYARSRHSLTRRRLPSVSDIYLARRYFTPAQVREKLWLNAFGTFAIRGGMVRRMAKAAVALFYLPDTLWKIRARAREAEQMLEVFPNIPSMERTGVSREEMVA